MNISRTCLFAREDFSFLRRLQLAGLCLLIAACAFGLAGCSTVPVTGRRQLVLISPEYETELGLTSFEKLKKEGKVCTDPAVNQLVQKVGQRLAAVAELPGAQWEFVVFENPEPNAFCLPGGKVGIYTGILPITKDEAGLATVLSHEIAHAVARHGAERLSEALLLDLVGQGLTTQASKADPRWGPVVAAVYGAGTQLGLALPHSRMQELEADKIGLIYMARAGYDPREAIKFWERFAEYNRQRGGATPIWFLSTHPLDEVRIQKLREALPEALQNYQGPR